MANKKGFLTSGELDTPVDIFTTSHTQNDYGEVVKTRTLLKQVWAKIITKGGNEKVQDDTIVGTSKVNFIVRYDSDFQIESANISSMNYLSVRYQNKYWNVSSIEYVGRGQGVVIKCDFTDNE